MPTALECREFFYDIFMDNLSLRRDLLRRWHAPYAPDPDAGGTAARLADLWQRFLKDILYVPVRFCMSPDYFGFYGSGTRSLRVSYAWLSAAQRHFLVYRIFAHRETLFRNVKHGLNNEFFLDAFVYDTHVASHIWQREMARDFVWMIANREVGALNVELIAAMQALLLDHPRGQRDLFLLNMHDALQGHCLLREVPCWGVSAWDKHPDEITNA